MSRTYSAEAIIVNRKNFGESDRLITFLSKYNGKFDALAKGVRKVASRRGPNLDLLNHVKASFASGRNFDVLTEVQALDTFRDLKSDLRRIGSGFFAAEIVNELLVEDQDEREVFELLLDSLKLMNRESEERKVNNVLRSFEIKFLQTVGLKPQLNHCSLCNRKLSIFSNYLSPEVGGVMDQDCAKNELFSQRISTDALKILRFYQSESWPAILKLTFPKVLEKEVQNILDSYLKYIIEKDLQSAKFLANIPN